MTSFDNPYAFLLALALPVWLFLGKRLSRRAGLLRFPLDEASGRLFMAPRGLRFVLSKASTLFGSAAYLALVLAAAGPNAVERRVVFPNRGDDVIFALDVSPSMGARDLEPNRLAAACELVDVFLRQDRADAVGVVMFGQAAALLCPPTTDYAVLRGRLEEIRPGMLGDGTAWGLGLAQAVRHAAQAGGNRDRVILLTDGENNAGAVSPEDACDMAARLGVSLTIIGVGSRGEVPLVYENPQTGERFEGTYTSGFDQAELRDLAARGGGEYISAADREALERAFRTVAGRMESAEGARSVTVRRSRAGSAILAALLSLALSWILAAAGKGALA